jgi:hypothetical protein
MYPTKYFHASKFSYLLCCNPTHKVKTKTRNGRETINSKPPKPTIMIGQLETMNIVKSYLLQTLQYVQKFVGFYQPQ